MSNHWIAAWGCPIAKAGKTGAEWMKDTTIRFNILMTVPGKALKFHFSNLFNKEESIITAASVSANTEGSSFDPYRLVPITFGGEKSGKMEAGGALCSDEIDFSFKAGETLTISLYFAEFTHQLTGHQNSGEFIKRWAASGDCTMEAELPENEYNESPVYPFIHTIEALSPKDCYSIVAFGDSITAQTWPDRLSRRLLELGKTNIAIIRKAIGGSRVLREYPCDLYRTYGPKGLDRFAREVLLPGVKKVFILHGINDIIHPNGGPFRPLSDQPSSEDLIEGLDFYIHTAHQAGIKVFLSPILPFEGWRTYNEEKEKIREGVNYWIYRQAPIEGVLPFELAVLDPDNPLRLHQFFDSGDHLHPSGKGAQAMAESIPEELL